MEETWSVTRDVLIIGSGSLLMIAGIIGCLLPVIPGPPLSYVALLLLQLREEGAFSVRFLVIWALVTVAVTVLDYVVPGYGTKRSGGSKYGIWGSNIGLVVGLIFFPPFGIFIGPLVGAFVGEMAGGKTAQQSVRPALGAFGGLLAGVLLKLVVCFWMGWYFVIALL